MPLYYVENDFGCGIRCAKNKKQASSNLLKEEGSNHAKFVRLARTDDINWVRGMGGNIPKDIYKKP
jgi:hypothetical protein